LKQCAANVTELWDRSTFGVGVTAQQAAAQFGWSLGVASEELEMAEERGALCREESVEGLKFWLNFLVDEDE
jgi:ESCRT-II complex subunit VPS36